MIDRSNKLMSLMGLLLFIGLMPFLQSCDKAESMVDEEGIVGRWSLTEVLADPGDGSGTFQPTDMEKILEFRTDGRVESQTSFCAVNESESGRTYSASYDDNAKTITPECLTGFPITYELTGKNELTLYYPCIEPCGEKYFRIGDGDDE